MIYKEIVYSLTIFKYTLKISYKALKMRVKNLSGALGDEVPSRRLIFNEVRVEDKHSRLLCLP